MFKYRLCYPEFVQRAFKPKINVNGALLTLIVVELVVMMVKYVLKDKLMVED